MKNEEITISIPKAILDFLRTHETELGTTAKEYIERNIVETVRADIDAGDIFVPEPQQVLKDSNLSSLFNEN